ncbi:alpha/beta fold hydrolase [Micromonospora sp. CA-240977]|uniref:alpha/beta fold hydrolase n=1 Tax=Micromonospora sp. CA-240977 TaxID=3239957 RepID=UPI003D9216FA
MAFVAVNGVRLNYSETGTGEPVLLIMGSGASGRAWHLHQVPALVAAGFRVITFDNRGIPPSEPGNGPYTIHDLVADTAGLIEALRLGPCRVVGTSMGAQVAQELATARPDLVTRLVLMATRGRTDRFRAALRRAEAELYDAEAKVPPAYTAMVQALQNLSPATQADDQAMADWLELFELTAPSGPGYRAQLEVDAIPERLDAYRAITAPCRVIAFADDVICPPHLGREVADAIPGADFVVVPRCGHYGYLEDPERVNDSIIELLSR